jgi:hypothetical protein
MFSVFIEFIDEYTQKKLRSFTCKALWLYRQALIPPQDHPYLQSKRHKTRSKIVTYNILYIEIICDITKEKF